MLVSKDPTQYMLAAVPFSFADRPAATNALDAFKNNAVIEITTPAFDTKARPEFNGCPVKSVLLLTKPTIVKHASIHAQRDATAPRPGCAGISAYYSAPKAPERLRLCQVY